MTRTSSIAALANATRARSEAARRRVDEAISVLTERGDAVTPTSVARAAGVSRQWLYTDTTRLAAIRLHQTDDTTQPPGSRASRPSQLRRIELLLDDNGRLRERVAELEARVATLYGELRSRQRRQT